MTKRKNKSVKDKKSKTFSYVKKYFPTLEKIGSAKSLKSRNNLIDNLPKGGVDLFCECCFNILYSRDIPKKSLKDLKRFPIEEKNIIRYLALTPKNKYTKKRRLLMKQSGGGIGSILAAVLPIITSLFNL